MSKVSLKVAAIFLSTLLAACGGGGGGSDSATATSNGQTGNGSGSGPTVPTTPTGSSGGSTSTPSGENGTPAGGATDSPAPTSPAGSSGGSTSTPPSANGTPAGGTTDSPAPTSPAGSSGGSTSTPSGTDGSPTGDASGGTTPPAEPFAAILTAAPANDSIVAGTVTLEVQGSSIENAELLPPDAYSPRLGVFTISPDKRRATLNFDTRSLPNGTLLARVSVFNRPAGSTGATEIVAMPTRTWLLRNDPPPAPATIPPASYMPEVRISSLNLPYVDPAPLRTMMAMDDASYEAMLANEWPRVQGVMYQYIPPHVVLMPPTPLGFSGPWYSCLQSPNRLACREAMNNMIGLMSSKAR
jgi:hypothetical protein